MPRDAMCRSCEQRAECQSVTVRVYRKRSQTEYVYRLCHACVQLLESLLEANAEGVGHSLFDHTAGGVPIPISRRRR